MDTAIVGRGAAGTPSGLPDDLLRLLPLRSPLPSEAFTCRGPALLIGRGRCVYDDLARAGDAHFTGARAVVNMMGLLYACRMADALQPGGANGSKIHKVDHWISLHADRQWPWIDYRAKLLDGRGRPILHGHKTYKDAARQADVIWPFVNVGGTTGLFATLVLLVLGYWPVIVCGVPMDNTGRWGDPPGWTPSGSRYGDRVNEEVWRSLLPALKGRAFSMSGRTRDWLGEPPAELMPWAA